MSSGGVPGLVAPSGLVAPNPNVAKAQDIADRWWEPCGRRPRSTGGTRGPAEAEGRRGPEGPGLDVEGRGGDAAAVRDAARGYLRDTIPEDATPAERKAWWEALTQEQREEYLAVYPDRIGNLDGIPALVRDAANRDNLQLLIGKLEGRDDDMAVTQLAGLREIDRQLQAGKQPPMFLLGIGDEGTGGRLSLRQPGHGAERCGLCSGLGTS
ncbi:hypothetical protein NKH18_28160 [Streptomyces sp. M10(2022)]